MHREVRYAGGRGSWREHEGRDPTPRTAVAARSLSPDRTRRFVLGAAVLLILGGAMAVVAGLSTANRSLRRDTA